MSSILYIFVAGLLTASSSPAKTVDLDEALELLAKNNPTAAAAKENVTAAAGASARVRAALFPKLLVSGAYVRNNEEVGVPLGRLMPQADSLLIQPESVWQAQGTLDVPLLQPSAFWQWLAAKEQRDVAQADSEVLRANLQAVLIATAWRAELTREMIDVIEQIVDAANEQAAYQEKAVESGIDIRLAYTRAQAEVVLRRTQLAEARQQLAELELALGTLLGQGERTRVLMPDLDPSTPQPSVEEALSIALRDRPDVKAAKGRLRATDYRVTASSWQYAPTLSANGRLFAATEPYPTGEQWGWQAILQLDWAVFDGGAREGRLQESSSRRRAAAETLRAVRLDVEKQVHDAHRTLELRREQLRLAREQKELAASAAQQAENSFSVGQIDSFERLNAQTSLYQARLGLLRARAAVAAARVELGRALGEPKSSVTGHRQ